MFQRRDAVFESESENIWDVGGNHLQLLLTLIHHSLNLKAQIQTHSVVK